MMLSHAIMVGLGGACGAMLRYILSSAIGMNGILVVNILGCFILGALVGFLAMKISMPQALSLFLIVGLLGGFTTFSAFSLESIHLIDTHKYIQAVAYITISVFGALGAFLLGRYLVKAVL